MKLLIDHILNIFYKIIDKYNENIFTEHIYISGKLVVGIIAIY
jgi:hypothetical protein